MIPVRLATTIVVVWRQITVIMAAPFGRPFVGLLRSLVQQVHLCRFPVVLNRVFHASWGRFFRRILFPTRNRFTMRCRFYWPVPWFFNPLPLLYSRGLQFRQISKMMLAFQAIRIRWSGLRSRGKVNIVWRDV